MSPAARLKHARHAVAGLLLPATWLALSGAARAEEPDATTTTTEAPATTTTTAAPAPTTTLPKEVRKKLEATAPARAFLAGMSDDDDAEVDAPVAVAPTAAPASTTPQVVAPSFPAPTSIRIDDGFSGAVSRPTRSSAPSVDGTAPAPTPEAPAPFTGVPTGDEPGSGSAAPNGGLALVAGAGQLLSGGSPDLIAGAPASLADAAALAASGAALVASFDGGPADTGQGENPERGPPLAVISTGDATATGNLAVTTIDQTTMIAVTKKGTVSLTTADNRDTGASWFSASLPAGMLGGRDARVASMAIGSSGSDAGNGTVTITTGDALASGNASTTIINQTTLVAVTTNGADVEVNQPAAVANIGTATAVTGGNTALGTTNGGSGSAIITTGDATAYGNRSTTVINQKSIVAVTGSNSSVRITQWASVDNIGTATATTGDNSAIGSTGEGDGTAVIRTGDATAIGNQSTTTIDQRTIVAVTGDRSTASIDQQADVNNVGTATASTGGNAAVATSGASYGSVLITTGDAQATGNVADTTVSQRGINIATGRFAGVSVTQGAGVINAGTALATTGRNTGVGAG